MSWISGLVDKAENILDKLDQNAATALQNQGNCSSNAGTHSVEYEEIANSAPYSTHVMRESLKSLNAMDTETALNLKNNLSCPQHYSLSPTSNLVAIDIDGAITNNQIKSDAITDTMKPNNNKERDAEENQKQVAGERCLIYERDIDFEQRYNDLEVLAQSLTTEKSRVQSELIEAQSFCKAYMHTISELESNLADSQRKNFELAEKFQMQIKETAQLRLDLEEYRKKAHRALQIKDNLISALKSDLNTGLRGECNKNINELNEIQNVVESLKREQENLKEENAFLLQQLDDARKDLKDSSNGHTAILSSMIYKEDTLNKEIRLEKQRSIQLESEQRVLSQELTTLRQQLRNQMARTDSKNQCNIKPISILRTENKTVCEDHEAYNMRIKSLTETLVDKQNCVELITADRNALRIQLEKVQDQLHEISFQGNSSSRGQRNIFSNTTDDVKAQFPLLMKETPFDNRVARRVKRVYSSLDSAGIRLGAFLRHYPLMRICVLIYIGLLHVWVIFVLLSSTPN